MAFTVGVENIPAIGDKVSKLSADKDFGVFDVTFESGKVDQIHIGSTGKEQLEVYMSSNNLTHEQVIKDLSDGLVEITKGEETDDEITYYIGKKEAVTG